VAFGEAPVSATPPRLHRNVWVATATSFLTDVSSDMLQSVLPLFLANVLGVRVWTIGLLYGLADTASSVLKLYSGWLSDRLRTRKWLAVFGYATSALSKPFLYTASTWGAVAGVRFVDRVGKGIRTAPRDALLADSTPANQRGFAFGLHRAGDSAGAVVGLLIAVWIVARVQGDARLLSDETFRTLVLWSLLPAFVAVVLLAIAARDVAIPQSVRRTPRIRIRGLGRPFAAFALCSLLFEFGNSADAFLVLRAQERGISVMGILWLAVAFNVVYTVISTPAGRLADRVPRKWLVFAGWLVYAGVYLGFALAGTATHVAVLYTTYGVYHGLVAGSAKALIADLVPAELRGTAYGSYAGLIGLASLPASVFAGVLWEGVGEWSGFGPEAPFFFGAAMATLAAGLLAVVVPSGPPPAAPTPGEPLPGEASSAATPVTPIPVVAAVIERDGRYLLGRRPADKQHGGLWEFPGGKLNPGETLLDGARRELSEELSLAVTRVGEPLYTGRDASSPFEILFVRVDVEGDPVAIEHSAIGWFTPAELSGMHLAPSDARFVRILAGPRSPGAA